MSVRLNLIVDDDIPALLTELAGGERKRGEKISELVRDLHRSRNKGGNQFDRIENELAGITGRFRELEGRIAALERRLAGGAQE